MRVLFFTYSILYISISLYMAYGDTSMIVSQILFSVSFLLFGLVTVAPVAIIISPRLIKSHNTDPRYLNLCFVAGLFRIILWACSPFGLRDHVTILLLNGFGLLIYSVFIERHIKFIDNEYFKY